MKFNLPYIDRIWRVRSTLVLDELIAPATAFDRLDPLFQAQGTEYAIEGDTLAYTKDNPNPQDKLATFTSGSLHVSEDGGRSTLSYDLSSPALLWCFLAPLLFLAFAQLAVVLNTYLPEETEASTEAEDEVEETKEEQRLHWIDEALGAPAPESDDEKADEEKEEEKEKERHSPTPAYVLAVLFAVIYAVGRILEPWLIRRTFRKALSEPAPLLAGNSSDPTEATARVAPIIEEREKGRSN